MRTAVRRVAITVALVAVVLLGLPLAVAVRTVVLTEERLELTTLATSATARVGTDTSPKDPIEFPETESGTLIGLYDTTGTLTSGDGPPAAATTARRAAAGAVTDSRVNGWTIVAVPIASQERIVGVVAVAAPTSNTWSRTIELWTALAGAATLALGAALIVANRRSATLSLPIENLAEVSQRVAAGDLTARASPSGIPELDLLAQAQNDTVAAIAELLERERRFTTDVSHQLRTPLARLELTLEAARRETTPAASTNLDEAVAEAAILTTIVTDVLHLARGPQRAWFRSADAPLGSVAAASTHSWRAAFARSGRRLSLSIPDDLSDFPVPFAVAKQVLDVLIDNALLHGVGTVRIAARELGDSLAFDVIDEGHVTKPERELFERGGFSANGHGIGLPVARELAEACGGRLVLGRRDPTTFTWLVPLSDSENQ